jgi:hypothetical protein
MIMPAYITIALRQKNCPETIDLIQIMDTLPDQ